MENNRKEELKNKIEELVKSKLSKFKKEEEEEKCVEPIVLIDVEDPEELQRMLEELGDIQEFTNLSDISNPDLCPPVMPEDIELMDVSEVELDQEEVEELVEIAKDINPIGDLMMIPCDVRGDERLLIDSVNCNMKPIPILGLIVVTPANTEVIKIELDANMQSDSEIKLHLLVNVDNAMVHVLADLATLISAGVLSLVGMVEGEPLEISPVEFRGITNNISLDEINDLCKGGMRE